VAAELSVARKTGEKQRMGCGISTEVKDFDSEVASDLTETTKVPRAEDGLVLVNQGWSEIPRKIDHDLDCSVQRRSQLSENILPLSPTKRQHWLEDKLPTVSSLGNTCDSLTLTSFEATQHVILEGGNNPEVLTSSPESGEGRLGIFDGTMASKTVLASTCVLSRRLKQECQGGLALHTTQPNQSLSMDDLFPLELEADWSGICHFRERKGPELLKGRSPQPC
jgi:hypothetical protein